MAYFQVLVGAEKWHAEAKSGQPVSGTPKYEAGMFTKLNST